jgi:hypothetical protein
MLLALLWAVSMTIGSQPSVRVLNASPSEALWRMMAWQVSADRWLVLMDDLTTLVAMDGRGKVHARVRVDGADLGDRRMKVVLGGFIDGETLWLADFHNKLVQFNLNLQPLKSTSFPKLFYIHGCCELRGNRILVAGSWPQSLREPYHPLLIHVFRWPTLEHLHSGLDKDADVLKGLREHEQRLGYGGFASVAADEGLGTIGWVQPFWPVLVLYRPSNGNFQQIPLKLWQQAWRWPSKKEEISPVRATRRLLWIPPRWFGIPIQEKTPSGQVRYWLEVVSTDGREDFRIDLPGPIVGRDLQGRWLVAQPHPEGGVALYPVRFEVK